MAVWSFQIADTHGVTQDFITPQGVKLTRRRCAASQLASAVPPTDPAIATLNICDHVVKAYRDHVLRFHGQISDPLSFSSAGAQMVASDPFYFLADRRLQQELDYHADLSDIGWNLISHEDARKPVRIRRGATAASVVVDAIYPDGSLVSDLIKALNTRDQGIWFWIDPVDGVPGILGEYRTSWPDAGSFQPRARFEYGTGTLGNLLDYQMQLGKPRNGVRVTGASVGNANLVPARRDDAASQAQYGLLEDDFSFTDLDDTTSLDQHALDQMQPNPPVTLTLTPKPFDPTAGNDSFVPTLFDDFDAGDIVPIFIRDEQLRVQGTARIGEATISVGDDANTEQLESLVVSGSAQLVGGVWQVTP